MPISENTLAKINRVRAEREAAGLVGPNGAAFATYERKAFVEARQDPARSDDEMDALWKLANAADRDLKRRG